MEISLDKNAFVITCNEKRYEMFVKIFNYYNIPLPIKFWGCQPKFNYNLRNKKLINKHRHDGCLFSHYSLYKIAQTLDLPYLIVYEDDVFPRKNILEYFDLLIKNVPNDWKFLKLEDTNYSGYVIRNQYNDYWFNGINNKRGSGTAAYIIKKELYSVIIDLVESNKLIKDNTNNIDCLIRINVEINQTNNYGYYVSMAPCFLQHAFHNEYCTIGMNINNIVWNTNKNDLSAFDTTIIKKING